MRQITVEEEHSIIQDIKAGLKQREIVAKYDVNMYQVYKIKRDNNLVGVAAQRRLAAREPEILRMLKSGAGYREIQKAIGVCSINITEVVRKYNLKGRLKKQRTYKFNCLVCGKGKTSPRRGGKYCCHNCRMKHYRFMAKHHAMVAEGYTKCKGCGQYFPTYKKIQPKGIPDYCRQECKPTPMHKMRFRRWGQIESRLERERYTTSADDFTSTRAVQCSHFGGDNIQCAHYQICLQNEINDSGAGFKPDCQRYTPRKPLMGGSCSNLTEAICHV